MWWEGTAAGGWELWNWSLKSGSALYICVQLDAQWSCAQSSCPSVIQSHSSPQIYIHTICTVLQKLTSKYKQLQLTYLVTIKYPTNNLVTNHLTHTKFRAYTFWNTNTINHYKKVHVSCMWKMYSICIFTSFLMTVHIDVETTLIFTGSIIRSTS